VVNESIFQIMWRPEVMIILILIAFYGLIGVLSSPGAILAGVIGATAVVVALHKVTILPVDTTGWLLFALAVALFVIDVFALAHGMLTGGGLAAFLIGGLVFFDRSDPLFRLLRGCIIEGVIVWAASFAFGVAQGLRAQRLPVKAGTETMLGKTVNALTPINARDGKVFIEGEYWNATSDTPVAKGQPVQITAVEGLMVKVKRET
jgi:membrane-bound serine protease (ClpP class)